MAKPPCSQTTRVLTWELDGFDEARVLGLAAIASSDCGPDSVDAAIRLVASHSRSLTCPS